MVRRPSRRARIAQWLVLLGLAAVAWYLLANAAENIGRRNIPFGFGYLGNTANFDIPFHLISFVPADTYARALLVCLLNTLLVSAMSIVTASLLGLLVGIMRLSANWLVRNLALGFIELVRNTPMLVQIIFWYVAVMQTLPGPRQSIVLPGRILLNIRGIYLPVPVFAADAPIRGWIALALVVATPLVWRFRPPGTRRLAGRPVGAKALALPLLALAVLGFGIDHLDAPALRGFNIAGGVQLPPELAAVWAGLSIYAAAFIAEIVRSTIQAVQHGQREAALSLGLKPRLVLFLVVLPQALRMMLPPLTSQYLNLIKSSSLGAAVGYPEIFQIFAGTVLNQSGRETETIIIVMGVFLGINLAVSAVMNWFNRRVSLQVAR
jgi:general L-amino acid transport system permease protein